jgi:hypothetical protein
MALEQELAAYKSRLPELHDQQGQFALIQGNVLAGVYGTYDDALRAGYEAFGLQPFLVKQIQIIEQVQFIARLAAPACLISPSN